MKVKDFLIFLAALVAGVLLGLFCTPTALWLMTGAVVAVVILCVVLGGIFGIDPVIVGGLYVLFFGAPGCAVAWLVYVLTTNWSQLIR